MANVNSNRNSNILNEPWFDRCSTHLDSKSLNALRDLYIREERYFRRLVSKKQRNCCLPFSTKQQSKLYKYETQLSICSKLLEKTNKLLESLELRQQANSYTA